MRRGVHPILAFLGAAVLMLALSLTYDWLARRNEWWRWAWMEWLYITNWF